MAGKKILIVDSDAPSRNFVVHNLEEHGFETLQSGSGKEGLIYAWRDHPDLIILDPVLSDISGEEIAVKLRQDARTEKVPMIALSSDPTVFRVKACLDAGFNEYIAKSGEALSTLNEVVNRLLGIGSSAKKKGGFLIVFMSAKGGTGTSSLCANVATTISQIQPETRVAVVDLVLPIGSIATIVGYEGIHNVVTVLDTDPAAMNADFFRERLMFMSEWKFHLLAGSPDPESSLHLKVERIWDLISALQENYDYVLIDLGRSLSKFLLPLIQNANALALILGTDISTVTVTKTLWDYLRNKGVKTDSVYAILNRAVGLEGLSKPEAEKALGLPIRSALPYLGGNFALTNNQHHPFATKFPNDTAAIVFREATQEMIGLAKRRHTGSLGKIGVRNDDRV